MDKVTLGHIENNYCVYGLMSSCDNKIRYIGISANVENRVKEHIKDIGRNKVNTYKKKWISKCIADGNKIEYLILDDSLSQIQAFDLEKHYIKMFKSFGATLVNGTLGGDGVIATKEVRDKMSKRTYRHTDATKKILSEKNIGKTHSNATKAKMSETHKMKGNKPIITDEIRKMWSENRKGNAFFKGKSHTEKTKSKISLSKKGIPSKKKVSVIQYTKALKFVKKWDSLSDADVVAKTGNISKAISGERKYAGGFIWKKCLQ